MTRDVTVAVRCASLLGEGALWDHRSGLLYWVDIHGQAIWRWRPNSEQAQRIDVAERVGFVALTEAQDVLLAGYKTGLVLLNLTDGAVQRLLSPEPDLAGNRINDGTVGPDGAVYFGTMDDNEVNPTGGFWRWDGSQAPVRFGPSVVVANGPAIDSLNHVIYTVDSAGRTIFVHEFADGVPGQGKEFIRFPNEWGYPDGLAIDEESCVWVCHWDGARVSRLRPDATLEEVLMMPTRNITKCAFGGDDLATLFITTAQPGSGNDANAGHVFSVDVGIRGLPANIMRFAAEQLQ